MLDIKLPHQMKPREVKETKALIQIEFAFREDEDFSEVMERLDLSFNKERMNAVRAIAKIMGVEIKFED